MFHINYIDFKLKYENFLPPSDSEDWFYLAHKLDHTVKFLDENNQVMFFNDNLYDDKAIKDLSYLNTDQENQSLVIADYNLLIPIQTKIESINIQSLSSAFELQEAKQIVQKIDSYSTFYLKENYIFYLNNSYYSDGLFIDVKRKNLETFYIFIDANNIEHKKNFIYLRENSSVNLVIHFLNNDKNHDCFSDMVWQFYLLDNANLNITIIHEGSETSTYYSFMHFIVSKNAQVNHTLLSNNKNHILRDEFHVDLIGEGAKISSKKLFIGKTPAQEKKIMDSFSYIKHRASNTTSDVVMLSVLEKNVTGNFYNKGYVSEGLHKIRLDQLNKNILLSDEANVTSRPELNIFSDDVKCTHGSATGFIEKNKLKYCMSRGISLDRAKEMVIKSFITDALNNDHSLIKYYYNMTGLEKADSYFSLENS